MSSTVLAYYCASFIIMSIATFFSYPTVTNIYTENPIPAEFPTITVCYDSMDSSMLSQTLVNCSFNGISCTIDEFYQSLVNCFTFNKGVDAFNNTLSLKQVLRTDSSLDLTFFLDEVFDLSGLTFYAHNTSLLPSSDSGFSVAKGINILQ